MSDFCYYSLLGQAIKISSRIEGKIVFQIYIENDDIHQYICLIDAVIDHKRKLEKQYVLISYDVEAKKPNSINRHRISRILKILKNIKLRDELAALFSDLPKTRLFSGNGFQLTRLTKQVLCCISDEPNNDNTYTFRINNSELDLEYTYLLWII